MTFTLFDATVPQFRQILAAVPAYIDKAEAYVAQHRLDEGDIVGARIIADMYDFAYQIKAAVFHSAGAIEVVKAGQGAPNRDPAATSFTELRALLASGLERLAAVTPDEINPLADKHIIFTAKGGVTIEFSGAKYLLSFAQPNFYFHVTTAYALLRGKGISIGKRDYLGAMQIRT